MVFTARLAQADLITETDFDNKLQSPDKKINSNKTKHLLVENELKKLERFDAAYFRGKIFFDGDGTQNLVFQLMYKYFAIVDNKTSSWESKGLSNEKISFFPRLINNQPPNLAYDNARMKLTFNGDFVK